MFKELLSSMFSKPKIGDAMHPSRKEAIRLLNKYIKDVSDCEWVVDMVQSLEKTHIKRTNGEWEEVKVTELFADQGLVDVAWRKRNDPSLFSQKRIRVQDLVAFRNEWKKKTQP